MLEGLRHVLGAVVTLKRQLLYHNFFVRGQGIVDRHYRVFLHG